MKGHFSHIEEETLKNENFRKVLYTGPKMQLVVMTLQPGEDIGEEVHSGHDQFFRFEEGEGEVLIGEEKFKVGDGDSAIVSDGTNHNVTNISKDKKLKLYTIYAPPEHPDGTVHKDKPKDE